MKIQQTKYGRGVFATKDYSINDKIEESNVIVLPAEDKRKIDNTLLYDYYFSWGEDNSQAAIALGNGSLYNHSYSPNAKYIKRLRDQTIEFVAIGSIKKGEEIFVNYNGNPDSKKPLWFNVDPLS